MNASSIASFFVYAAALLAAVLGDAVVEGISNGSILWHGNYTDRSSLDLLPVSVLAVLVLLGGIGVSFMRQARVSRLSPRSLVLSTAQILVPPAIVRLLPRIFGLQLLALFIMETAEQAIVFGHALGGTLWLGGPLFASLAVHLVFAIACAFMLSAALQTLANVLARVVDCILGGYQTLVRPRRAIVLSAGRISYGRESIVIGSVVGRGPPLTSRL